MALAMGKAQEGSVNHPRQGHHKPGAGQGSGRASHKSQVWQVEGRPDQVWGSDSLAWKASHVEAARTGNLSDAHKASHLKAGHARALTRQIRSRLWKGQGLARQVKSIRRQGSPQIRGLASRQGKAGRVPGKARIGRQITAWVSRGRY